MVEKMEGSLEIRWKLEGGGFFLGTQCKCNLVHSISMGKSEVKVLAFLFFFSSCVFLDILI